VILCGGAGERLWPMSRPERPKPFLRLIGRYSGLQAAALRARPFSSPGRLIVVGGNAHRDLIQQQLAEIGVEAQLLLEPSRRDTAAAIAAAAGWVGKRDTGAIIAVLPADHHIPNEDAFEAAIRASLVAASDGAIVSLGVQPTAPSAAYGYIRPGPGDGQVKPVEGFEEKPTPSRAAELIAAGALWNIGVFVARAETLVGEVRTLAAPVAEAVERALADAAVADEVVQLGAAFNDAPSLAFDRAVMEKTRSAAVLPVKFAWSDLGAWNAVLAAGPVDDQGNSLGPGVTAVGAAQVLGRAAAGMSVTVLGAARLVVVAEPDAVLVCGLEATQAVGRTVNGRATPRFSSLHEAAESLGLWLRTAALPLWATVGVDPASGAFREALTWDGVPADPFRRTRVQARQTFVFASASAEGLPGPWLATARGGMNFLRTRALDPDGWFAAQVGLDGIRSLASGLYDHSFVLLALAGLALAGEAGVEGEALALLGRLEDYRHISGFREVGAHPFQANAQMHLLEAALVWEGVGEGVVWSRVADELGELALKQLIDPADGALREFFDSDWQRLAGDAGRIEPGHQFEWAWLLTIWGRRRGDARGEVAARRLFEIGRRGFDPTRCVVVDALRDDRSALEVGARLWPQTEHLKAALVLGETQSALEATNALAAYLDVPARGVWRERMKPDGTFRVEPAPATSLYHLYLAIQALRTAIA